MTDLMGKVAIVTGGSQGIGEGIATALANSGCKVAILDISDARGEQVAERLREVADTMYVHCDVAAVGDIERAFGQVVDAFGGVDILVNNAGVPVRDYIADITEEKWEWFNAVNEKSVFFFSKIVAEHIRERGSSFGRIVNLGSVRSERYDTFHSGYSISKAAVNAITKSFAVAYGRYGITSNAVALGFVMTPMTEHYRGDPAAMEELKNLSPIQRAVEVHEVADTVAFLASVSAGAINGQVLNVDGGLTIMSTR